MSENSSHLSSPVSFPSRIEFPPSVSIDSYKTHGAERNMASNVPVVAVRGSTGVWINVGPPSYDLVSAFTRDESKSCKAMLFSPEGSYFAWVNGKSVTIASTATWKVVAEIPKPRIACIEFSPLGTYLMTWEPFVVTPDDPKGGPNLHIWRSCNGELVYEVVHKKQTDWQPHWTSDEKLCARNVNTDVLLYADAAFDTVAHRVHHDSSAITAFSLAPGPPPHHLLCYVPGRSGQPSFGRLFQCPKFDMASVVASKSFFQADKVEMMWNRRGNGVLLMTSVEVDKTGSSYYGKQALHYLDTRGETSMVMLSKDGPIYSVAWSPKSTEFCVVYGFSPAKATLFNQKCEPVFDFGTGPRNCIHYNPHGNILLLGGFGNLSGGVELWDVAARRTIAKLDAPDTTLLHWSPDGEHFMVATTAPRLRVNNGFKIYHYSGALLYERPWNAQEELWEVLWQAFPDGKFPHPKISLKLVEGIQPTQPIASKQAYRPPSARGAEPVKAFKLHDDDELPSNARPAAAGEPSKAALRQRKKRDAKKVKREAGGINGEGEADAAAAPAAAAPVVKIEMPPKPELTDDPEKNKKIKKLRVKLVEIARLKELQSTGHKLELNQLEKIKKENELEKEMNQLVL